MTRDLIEGTLDDLMHLRDTLNNDASKSDVRRASAIMRRLLVDGSLAQVWGLLGNDGLPEIETSRFAPDLGGVDIDYIEMATAGGFVGPDATLFSMVALLGGQGGAGPMTENVTLPLDRYMIETMMIVDGARIRRKQVVRYIANKRGGVHYDERRGRKWELSFPYLDKAFSQFQAFETNIVMGILRGMGQELTSSPHIAGLLL